MITKINIFATCVLFFLISSVQIFPQWTRDDPPQNGKIKANNFIDELVFDKLSKKHITPSPVCSDEVFLRRVFLGVTGALPANKEVRSFLADKNPDKRKILIDKLLASDEFADYWAMKWSDILRVKAEFPSNLWPVAAEAYHRWIRTCIVQNMPYDKFAYALLTSSGSNFKTPQVNFYRAMPKKDPLSILNAVALPLMGSRAQKWTDEERYGMAVFFAKVGYKNTQEWKEEIVYFNEEGKFLNPKTGKPQELTFLDGERVSLSPGKDPREAFANWLISPDNKWFAKNVVNRIWYWLMGKGIINEPDDIRPDNPAQNEKLLARLEKELIKNDYDLKSIYKAILNSNTFQLSSLPTDNNQNYEADFSHYYVRQLNAEVLIDAIDNITGTGEPYSSLTPEPYTYIPEDEKTVSLADGSITSPFLEIFGRPPRDTGFELERNNAPTIQQRLHLLNSTHIQKKLQGSQTIKNIISANKNIKDIIINLYINILSRYPTQAEGKTAENYFTVVNKNKTEAAVDLAWALINTKEFSFQH